MLGNRTVSGHEIDDNHCAKIIEALLEESGDRADANFTAIIGSNASSRFPSQRRPARISMSLL